MEESHFDDLPGPLRLDVLLNVTRELLETLPLFRYCGPALRNTLLMTLKAQTYAPDGYTVREGELGKEIHFIERCKTEITSDEGREIHGTSRLEITLAIYPWSSKRRVQPLSEL